jgi:transcriptional regulator with XRE-family HTH domain
MLVNETALALVRPPDRAAWDNADVLRRAAERVREWRRLHGLSQIAFARRTGISVGCLQGFETGTRRTRDAALAKIAAGIGTTLDDLTRLDAGARPDPNLADLKPEDLRIARAYHHSGAEIKHAIKRFFLDTNLLTSDERRERIAGVIARLLLAADDELQQLEILITGAAVTPPAPAPPKRPTDK